MAKNDVKVKSITGDSLVVEPTKVDRTSTYMKLAGLALGSYFLAKEDPYVLDGLSKELRRQEEAADVTENEFVKGAASSVSEVLAKNALAREKRVNTNLETIDVLVGYEMDPLLAAKATELNMGGELQALRKKFPNINLNKVFKQINGLNLPGYTNKDLAKILVGQPTKLNMDFKTLGGPKRNTFLSGFMGQDTSRFAQDKVKRIVESQNVQPKDGIDYEGSKAILQQVEKGEYGKQILALASTKDESLVVKRRAIAEDIKGYMGVEVGVDSVTGGYTYTSGSKENQLLFRNVANALESKITEIYNANLQATEPDPTLTTTKIRKNLVDQFTETVVLEKSDGKGGTISDVVVRLKREDKADGVLGEYTVNKVLGKNLLPSKWKPAVGGTSSNTTSVVTKSALTKADKILALRKAAEKKIATIKKNSNLINVDTIIQNIKDELAKDIANVK
jgi:hypothetical protein|tara:strand:+ start:1433 stop:2782 length:1350 start_codon:yes stop_codon:yes gene_type:complete